MSYDLAVWEGDRPANDLAAAAELKLLYDRYVGSADNTSRRRRPWPTWADQLRTAAREVWRFELTSARQRPVRDPDGELARRVLVRLSADNHFAVLTRADGWCIQAGYGAQAGTRPGNGDPTLAARFPWQPYVV
ncbi:hypothetical protein AB0C12_04125 [Actinoplanes sp. NPDC048967]|uniref:hypothetical protein n=1 Tax=Actinoplanes sp. NPDC048967 TaxID=3155269 RepID=UPI0033EF66BF